MYLLGPVWAILVLLSANPSSDGLGVHSWQSHDPDLGPLPHGVVGRIGSTRLRHGSAIRSLTFSPDGALLASADRQGSVIVWETTTGRIVRRWDLPDGIRGPVGFSADGRRVVWSTGDGYIRTHDVRTGTEVRAIRTGFPYGIRSLEPGRIVVTDLVGRCRTFDEETGRQIETIVVEGRAADAVSACGQFEASFTSESVLNCRDRIAKTEQQFGPGDYRFARSGCVRFSADSRHLFATETEGGVLRLERSTGRVLNRYGPFLYYPPDRLAVSPDGSCLAVAATNRIHLFDTVSGVERFAHPEQFAQPPAMRLSPDGRFLLLSGCYAAPREEAWELATARRASVTSVPISDWQGGTPMYSRQSADGRFRVTHGGDTQFNQFDTSVLRFWNASGSPAWSVKKGLPGRGGYAFSPNGSLACVVEEKGLGVYDSATGRLVELLPYTTSLTKREWAGSVAFTHDGHAVVTAHPSGLAYWPLGFAGHAREIRLPRGETLEGREGLLALSPDGRLAVVETDRLELLVYEVTTLQERFRIASRARGPASSMLFARDGRHLIVANGDSTVTIHDLFAGAAPPAAPADMAWEARWSELAGDAGPAFRSMQMLATRPEASVNLLRVKVRPTVAPPERTDPFVAELDAPRYQKREVAQGELTRLAHASRPALLAASRTALSPEMRQRVDVLLKATRGPDLSPDGIRAARAVELLERLRTSASTALLMDWAAGPEGDTLAEAARAALARSGGTR